MSVKQSVITVTAQQGDSLDSVIYRYFGRSSGLLEATLAINPHLTAMAILPMGTLVYLKLDDSQARPQIAGINLWD